MHVSEGKLMTHSQKLKPNSMHNSCQFLLVKASYRKQEKLADTHVAGQITINICFDKSFTHIFSFQNSLFLNREKIYANGVK